MSEIEKSQNKVKKYSGKEEGQAFAFIQSIGTYGIRAKQLSAVSDGGRNILSFFFLTYKDLAAICICGHRLDLHCDYSIIKMPRYFILVCAFYITFGWDMSKYPFLSVTRLWTPQGETFRKRINLSPSLSTFMT